MSRRIAATTRLAWVALIGNVLVILQGAVVRITGSGAGCGRHWPSCNGEFLPLTHTTESLIEFSHRLLSLAVLLVGAWLLARAFRLRRERPGFFAFALASSVFLLFEALLGAATVLLGLTGENATFGRGVMVAVHLVNSLLLVGSLTATVVYVRDGAPAWPLRIGRQASLAAVLGVALAGMLILNFTGGIAALGNTIFPSESLADGIAADFDPASHPLIRLRILHPLIAISVGIYLFLSLGLGWWLKPVAEARRIAQLLFGVYLLQLGIGTANLAFLAPAVLQLLHLGTAVLAFGLLAALIVTALGHAPVAARGFGLSSPNAMEKA